jgi:hypothetical protein
MRCRRQSSSGDERWRPATASSWWRPGSGVVRLGEASGEALRRWASSGATRGGQEKQAGASRSAAWRPAVALLCGRGGAEEEERGGAPRAKM